jgi:hypothetical protein
MTAGPSETPIEAAAICPFNSLTEPLTVLRHPCPWPALPPAQVPANWAVLQILAQSRKSFNPHCDLRFKCLRLTDCIVAIAGRDKI